MTSTRQISLLDVNLPSGSKNTFFGGFKMINIFYLFTVFMRINRQYYDDILSEGKYSIDPMDDFLHWVENYFYDLPQYQSKCDDYFSDLSDQVIENFLKFLFNKLEKKE